MSVSKLAERRLKRGQEREEKSKHVIDTIRAYAKEKEFPELVALVESAIDISAACSKRDDGDEIMRKVAGEIANLFLSHFGGGIMKTLEAIAGVCIDVNKESAEPAEPADPTQNP